MGMRILVCLWLYLGLFGCVRVPGGLVVVENLDAERYLGTWYEIARLDHSFERGMSQVTARYTARSDGGIDVLNRGYLADKGEWKEAHGRAYFVGDRSHGRLKVSFFGPFYGGYNIIALDHEEYRYSLVAGPSRGFLWILAREPRLDAATLDGLLNIARDAGFDTEALIFVAH